MERLKQVENDKYGMIKIKHQMIDQKLGRHKIRNTIVERVFNSSRFNHFSFPYTRKQENLDKQGYGRKGAFYF